MANPKFEQGIQLAIPDIKKSEGFRENAYKDIVGVVTIGYGFTKAVIPGLKMGDKITRAQADKLLEDKLRKEYATPLANAIKVWDDPKFTAQMFAALLNMIWQIGISMTRHDIVKRINEKNYAAAADLITQKAYTTADGKVFSSLVARREKEAAAFRAGMLVKAAKISGAVFAVIGLGIAGYWLLRRREIAKLQEVRREKQRVRELALV